MSKDNLFKNLKNTHYFSSILINKLCWVSTLNNNHFPNPLLKVFLVYSYMCVCVKM